MRRYRPLRVETWLPGHRQQRTAARQVDMTDHGGLQREQSIQHEVHERRRGLNLQPGFLLRREPDNRWTHRNGSRIGSIVTFV